MDIKTATQLLDAETMVDFEELFKALKIEEKEEIMPYIITIISLMTAISRTIQTYPNLGIKNKLQELLHSTNELARPVISPQAFQDLKKLENQILTFLSSRR